MRLVGWRGSSQALRTRYRFEQQKVLDYDERLLKLKRRYRTLKDLEVMIACPKWEVEQIKKQFAENRAKAESLEDKIRAAERQKSGRKDRHPGGYER